MSRQKLNYDGTCLIILQTVKIIEYQVIYHRMKNKYPSVKIFSN